MPTASSDPAATNITNGKPKENSDTVVTEKFIII
jgi:hypothetical protein